ncbi:hypothetical protein CAI21_22025 [Alkalilimnicola ehrlichii]|uniref:Terminase small subunit n=1 Tax=Alkalilimnicola ehrlichii TaxID=351052 RepID=A0A3E0WQA4_9GAMM|nr:DUF1441 family protein [Alkalilimnicola ehrlichii]RFA24355.1 hypothetical protein CAI21_22025 [Alkalilimnicola ehrlichii]RFA35142.1 hypothetical protein CAL65_13635 [Alkalilimnicola ehrlichii]
MGAVANVNDANLFSINRLSQMTGMARETITRKVQGIKPSGTKSGHPVYHWRDVGPALYGDAMPAAATDPNELPATERDRWYASELKRLEYEQELGQLLKAEDVRSAWAGALKAVMLGLETLTDVVERDAGLTPEQTSVIQRTVDRMRDQLYRELSGEEDDNV